MGLFSAIVLVVSVLSTAYQYVQQSKAKKKAEEARKRAAAEAAAAEDARKGFETVVDGEIAPLCIPYGRNAIGGVRVFHTVRSTLESVAGNASKSFSKGACEYTTNKTLGGKRREHLLFQQAICKGDISAVYDIVFDDNILITNPSLVATDSDDEYDGGTEDTDKWPDAGFRVDVHNSGNKVCQFMLANAPERKDAKFTGVAYLTACFKLNRNDPQFGSVPAVKVFCEGRPVQRVVSGVLQPTFSYSNNNAWCLLNYLLYEANIHLHLIDLNTFEAAAAVCDTVIQNGVACGGKIWSPTDKSRTILNRNLPLYECNILLNTADTTRTNVEKLLATMGDARLVRSEGIYKLSLEYPESDAAANVVDYINDDRIILAQTLNIQAQTSEERLNSCTIRFSNEDNNFKTDTVTWPQKTQGNQTIYTDGKYYPTVNGWDTTTVGKFLNDYGIWAGEYDAAQSFSWRVMAPVSGTYTITFVAVNTGSLTINGVSVTSSSTVIFKDKVLRTSSVVLTADSVYTIKVTGNCNLANKKLKGVAGRIIASDGTIFWTSHDIAYSGINNKLLDNALYLQYLAEDNNIELSSDISVDGIIDSYHAMAKAEEMVRMSRTANTYKLEYTLIDVYPEPGDIISVDCEDLDIDNLLIRVDTVAITLSKTIQVQGTRFSYNQLAWNVKDNVYSTPERVFNTEVLAPIYLEYFPGDTSIVDSSGYLKWSLVYDSDVQYYELYIRDPVDTSKWNILGSSYSDTFDLPDINYTEAVFGVRSVAGQRYSKITLTEAYSLSKAIPPAPALLSFTKSTTNKMDVVDITWNVPLLRPDTTPYKNHWKVRVYRSTVNNIITASIINQEEVNSSYRDIPLVFGALHYWLTCVSWGGIESAPTYCGSLTIASYIYLDDTFVPAAPTSITAEDILGSILIKWTNPPSSGGGGHESVLIFAAEWSGTTAPAYASATLLAVVMDATSFTHVVGGARKFSYWLRSRTHAGGISTAVGPYVEESTSLSFELADGAVTQEKLSEAVNDMILNAIYVATNTSSDFNASNNRNTAAAIAPTVANNDSAITHSVRTNGSADIVFNWSFLIADEGTIDGFQIIVYTSTANTVYNFDTPTLETVYVAPANKRSFILLGVSADIYYTFGIRAYRKVDKSLVTSGELVSTTVKSTYSAENPFRPSSSVAFSGNVTGNINGVAATVVSSVVGDPAAAINTKATTISGSKIATESLTADQIAVGSLTADRLVALSITADQLAANAITASKIQAGAVEADHLAANAIKAEKIVAGTIDAALTINSPVINGGNGSFTGTITTETGTQRAVLDAGDLTFYDYYANEFHQFKSVTRTVYGSCVDGEVVNIGYFREQPKILLSPKSLLLFNTFYKEQDQSIRLDSLNIIKSGDNWYFTAACRLELTNNIGSAGEQTPTTHDAATGLYTISSAGGPWTIYTREILLPGNVIYLSATAQLKRVYNTWVGVSKALGFISAVVTFQYKVNNTWISQADLSYPADTVFRIFYGYKDKEPHYDDISFLVKNVGIIQAFRIKVVFTKAASNTSTTMGANMDTVQYIKVISYNYNMDSATISINGSANYIAVG